MLKGVGEGRSGLMWSELLELSKSSDDEDFSVVQGLGNY